MYYLFDFSKKNIDNSTKTVKGIVELSGKNFEASPKNFNNVHDILLSRYVIDVMDSDFVHVYEYLYTAMIYARTTELYNILKNLYEIQYNEMFRRYTTVKLCYTR